MNLKQKFLDKSDSYNFYKNGYENCNKEIEKLAKEFDDYKKQNDKILNSYNDLFNDIFLNFELTPKGALKYTQELCLELLTFLGHICEKHGVEYWLDAGNALGALRHNGYVPWDDDLDIGMMRGDCEKFLDVIDDELKLYQMDDIITVSRQRQVNERYVSTFTQIFIENDGFYAGVDIFPCDYIEHPPEDIENRYIQSKKDFKKNILNGMDKKDAINEYYSTLNLSYDRKKYFLPCMEGVWGSKRHRCEVFETDKVFPLKKVEFEGRLYPAPNDLKYYVSKFYDEHYMEIPKVVYHHRRLKDLKYKDGYEENFKTYLERFKQVNKKFE